MQQSWEIMTLWAPTLILVVVRLCGAFVAAPVFGHSTVPVRLRVFVSIVISLGVAARLSAPVACPSGWVELLAGVGFEALIGLSIGYAARVVLVGAELGAFHVAQQMGVGLAGVFDPLGGDRPGPIGRLFYLLALVIFLAIGGHRHLIAAMLKTFDTVPLLGFVPGRAVLEMIVSLLAASFVVGLKLAAPVLISLLLATAAMGLIQKTIPQFHILSAGMPIRVMLTLVMLAAVVALMLPLMEKAWDSTVTQMFGWIEALNT